MSTSSTTAPARLEQINPESIVFETNIRENIKLDPQFVAAVKEHGVLLPILAYENDKGEIVVRDGQLRTLAARECGTPTIPANVYPSAAALNAEDEVARISQQLVLNDRRTSLTSGERMGAMHQMQLAGLTVTQIAKKTATKKKDVQEHLDVAGSQVATNAVQEHQVTFDQALGILEFEDDHIVSSHLTKTAAENPSAFVYELQSARDNRKRAENLAVAVANLKAAGTAVVLGDDEERGRDISELSIDGDDRKRLTVELHKDCPGRAVRVSAVYYSETAREIEVCLDPAGNGHTVLSYYAAKGGPMTDEQKAERRLVVANNKAWDTAETVRREWLTNLIARKAAPKNASLFIALALTQYERTINNEKTVAQSLLGIENISGRHPIAQYVTKNPTQAAKVALAHVLGGLEGATSRETWRYTQEHSKFLFTWLRDWGYNLSRVELLVLGETAPEDSDQ